MCGEKMCPPITNMSPFLLVIVTVTTLTALLALFLWWGTKQTKAAERFEEEAEATGAAEDMQPTPMDPAEEPTEPAYEGGDMSGAPEGFQASPSSGAAVYAEFNE